MAMPIHVSLQGNLVLPTLPAPTLSMHDFAPIPPAPAPPPAPAVPAIEPPVPVMWPPGFGLQQNKLTTTVYHKYQWIMLDGHDCGHMIPHVTIPPNNIKIPLHIMFSSRKVMFSASTVKANGTPIGCSQLLMFPMMTCMQPVSLPTSYPVMNLINTVTVGMTLGDVIAGMIGIACSVITDVIVARLSKWEPEPDFGKDLRSRLLGAGSPAEFLVKAGFNIVAGGAKILLTGEGQIQVGIGSGWAQVQVTYTRSEEANQFGVQGQWAPVPGVPASVSASYQRTYKPDGSTSSQSSAVAATPVSQTSYQSTTDRDASGKVTQQTEQTVTSGGISTSEGAAEGSRQSTTTTKPGEAPTTDQSGSGAVSGPFGTPGHVWGGPL